MVGLASLLGVLLSAALLGALMWVVGIALLGQVVACREDVAKAGARALALFVLAGVVFVVAVVLIEFATSGAWSPAWTPPGAQAAG